MARGHEGFDAMTWRYCFVQDRSKELFHVYEVYTKRGDESFGTARTEEPVLTLPALDKDDLIGSLAMLIRGATREGAIFQSVAALDNKLGVRDE
jgi:putative hemolysin